MVLFVFFGIVCFVFGWVVGFKFGHTICREAMKREGGSDAKV
jgi:hypothetical protein